MPVLPCHRSQSTVAERTVTTTGSLHQSFFDIAFHRGRIACTRKQTTSASSEVPQMGITDCPPFGPASLQTGFAVAFIALTTSLQAHGAEGTSFVRVYSFVVSTRRVQNLLLLCCNIDQNQNACFLFFFSGFVIYWDAWVLSPLLAAAASFFDLYMYKECFRDRASARVAVEHKSQVDPGVPSTFTFLAVGVCMEINVRKITLGLLRSGVMSRGRKKQDWIALLV